MDEAAILRVLTSAGADRADITVTLSPRPDGTGFDLSFEGSYLGLFADEEAAAYDFLPHFIANGLTPLATARATRLDDGSVDLFLRLPEPQLCIPFAGPSSLSWILLPDGAPRRIAHPSPMPGQPGEGRTEVLVTLSFDGAGEIVASLDGTLVGALDSRDAAHFAPALRRIENCGGVAVARGYIDPGSGELMVCADPPSPGTELRPQVSSFAAPGFLSPPGREPHTPYPTKTFLAEQDARAAALQAEHDDPPPPHPQRHTRVTRVSVVVGALVLASAGVATFKGHTRVSDADACDVINVVRSSADFDGVTPVPSTAAAR